MNFMQLVSIVILAVSTFFNPSMSYAQTISGTRTGDNQCTGPDAEDLGKQLRLMQMSTLGFETTVGGEKVQIPGSAKIEADAAANIYALIKENRARWGSSASKASFFNIAGAGASTQLLAFVGSAAGKLSLGLALGAPVVIGAVVGTVGAIARDGFGNLFGRLSKSDKKELESLYVKQRRANSLLEEFKKTGKSFDALNTTDIARLNKALQEDRIELLAEIDTFVNSRWSYRKKNVGTLLHWFTGGGVDQKGAMWEAARLALRSRASTDFGLTHEVLLKRFAKLCPGQKSLLDGVDFKIDKIDKLANAPATPTTDSGPEKAR